MSPCYVPAAGDCWCLCLGVVSFEQDCLVYCAAIVAAAVAVNINIDDSVAAVGGRLVRRGVHADRPLRVTPWAHALHAIVFILI